MPPTRRAAILVLLSAARCPLPPGRADAEVRTITIASRAPALGGQVFGAAGAYEDIKGIAAGEIDPRDPRNALITDLELAPKNASGRVEYRTTFTIRRPVGKSAGVLPLPPNVRRYYHPGTGHGGGA